MKTKIGKKFSISRKLELERWKFQKWENVGGRGKQHLKFDRKIEGIALKNRIASCMIF